MARIELVSSNPSLVLGLSLLDRDWDIATATEVTHVAHLADVVVVDVSRASILPDVPEAVGLVVLADEGDVPELPVPGVLLHRPCTVDDIADAIDQQLRRERPTAPPPVTEESAPDEPAADVVPIDEPVLDASSPRQPTPSDPVDDARVDPPVQPSVATDAPRSFPPLFAGFAARLAPNEAVAPIALEPEPAVAANDDTSTGQGDQDDTLTPFADAFLEFTTSAPGSGGQPGSTVPVTGDATPGDDEDEDEDEPDGGAVIDLADPAPADPGGPPRGGTLIDLTTSPLVPPDERPSTSDIPGAGRVMPVPSTRLVRSTVLRVAPPLPEIERGPFTSERTGLKLLDRESSRVKRRTKLLARKSDAATSQRSMEERLGRMLFAASELEQLLEELPVLRDRSALAAVIVAEAFEALALDTCGLWVWQDGAWHVLATEGFTLHERRMQVQASQPLFSEVHATGGAVLIDPIEQVMAAVSGIGGAHTRSFAAAAIAAGEGRYGILAAGRERSLDADDLDDLLALARQAAPGMAAAELVARLARSAARQGDDPVGDDDGVA